MEAYLVFNGAAGSTTQADAELYQEALAKAGYSPVYLVTETEDDVLAVLESARDLVVVVGGDGSLRAVATRLVGKNLPISLIPAGTANNFGSALGVFGEREAEALIHGLSNPRKVKVDLGVLKAPWGENYFLEGAGFGLFAEALSRYKPEDGKSIIRGAQTLMEVVSQSPARRTCLRFDGKEEEREYLLVEGMNTPALGYRITLAAEADVSDGKLDLVRVDATARDSYLQYLNGIVSGSLHELDSVTVDRVSHFDFLWDGFPIHQDAEYQEWLDYRSQSGVWVRVEVLPGALEFWLPEEVPAGVEKETLAS
jgi:diacylglycerol kinase family enzyme